MVLVDSESQRGYEGIIQYGARYDTRGQCQKFFALYFVASLYREITSSETRRKNVRLCRRGVWRIRVLRLP